MIAVDNAACQVVPPESGEPFLTWHVAALRDLGLLVGELFDLHELAADCAADGVSEGFFVAAPAIILACPGESRPARTAASVSGKCSSSAAVPIAARTSPGDTPKLCATSAAPFSDFEVRSATRFAAFANIASVNRRMTPSL